MDDGGKGRGREVCAGRLVHDYDAETGNDPGFLGRHSLDPTWTWDLVMVLGNSNVMNGIGGQGSCNGVLTTDGRYVL